jgi:glyoxylase I family protein
MIRGIHHVAIATHNIDEMLVFYRDALGFDVVTDYTWESGNKVADAITNLPDSAARHIMLIKGNAYFELFKFSHPTMGPGDPERRVCDPGFTHFCVDVDDVDEEYERLLQWGMTFHSPPQKVFPGVRTVYGRDPDGNVVELQQVEGTEHRIALPHFVPRPPGSWLGSPA